MNLNEFLTYRVGNTPMMCASSFCPRGNLLVKLERDNKHGSIKERAAYFIIRDLIQSGILSDNNKLVESSSGNLGLSLGLFAKEIGVEFLCLMDPTIPPEKFQMLTSHHINVKSVSLGTHKTYRDARIQLAKELDAQPGWIWTNQYDNPSNVRAHFETTGPEIWAQTNGNVDFVVCSVGSGGTVCGTGLFLKQVCPQTSIIAVEPLGSTIFGGKPRPFLTVGAGMSYKPGLIREYGHVIDFYSKIDDTESLRACHEFFRTQGIWVGITTGSLLTVASRLAEKFPDKTVVVVSADGGEQYQNVLKTFEGKKTGTSKLKLIRYVHLKEKHCTSSAQVGQREQFAKVWFPP